MSTGALTNGVFTLTLDGVIGRTYAIERSADLVNWISFATNSIPANGPPIFTNAISLDNSFRSFRARTSQ